MKQTRERTLEALLAAFNETGYSSLSIRQMAAIAGMSHGNLRYHFERKEDVLMALLQQMLEKMDKLRNLTHPIDNPLANTLEGIKQRFEIQHEYRFLFLEQVSLGRQYPVYQDYMQTLFRERTEVMKQQLEKLEGSGLLNPTDWLAMASYLFFFSMNWMISAQLFKGQVDQADNIKYFARMCFDHLKPHLSADGEKLYQEIGQ